MSSSRFKASIGLDFKDLYVPLRSQKYKWKDLSACNHTKKC